MDRHTKLLILQINTEDGSPQYVTDMHSGKTYNL